MKLVRESILNEIGEANVKPYEWHQENARGTYFTFKTENKELYIVHFEDVLGEGRYAIDFTLEDMGDDYDDIDKVSYNIVTNKGHLFRIMATVIDIIKNKIKNDFQKKIQSIIVTPEKNKKADDRRYKIYQKFIEKHLPFGWAVRKDEFMGVQSLVAYRIPKFELFKSKHNKTFNER
jgi:hypothetical protein